MKAGDGNVRDTFVNLFLHRKKDRDGKHKESVSINRAFQGWEVTVRMCSKKRSMNLRLLAS